MTIADHRETIKRAYYAISFDPERRADIIIKDYTPEFESLDSDEKKEKYLKYFLAWINAESRCMSSMITGPANFPVHKNRKNMERANSAYERFRNFVKKINHVRIRTLSPEDDLEAMIKKYDTLFSNHEKMKAVNKIQRSKSKNKISEIMEILDITREKAEAVTYFESFSLRNNLARMKNTKERILALKNRINVKGKFEIIEFDGGKIDIINDRVCIFHNSKPDQEIILKLKRRGFRWSPKFKNWCRKHTAQALADAKEIIGAN